MLKKSVPAMLIGMAFSTLAWSQAVEVQNAWVRATVPGQMATGAFMTLKAKSNARLVGGASPVAGVVEVHEMKMDGGVMKMRAVEGGLPLAQGSTVELKPGGYHVMLMDLKQALPKDSTVPLTLVLRDDKGVESKIELKVPVNAMPMGGMQMNGMPKQ